MKEITSVLKKTGLFKNLDAETLNRLAAYAVERKFSQGSVLFFAGEPAKGLFVIARGVVCGSRIDGEGREQVIFVERAPATVAEVPAFDNGAYFSTVIAESEALVYFIEKSYIRNLCLENPSFAFNGLRVLAQRIRDLAAMVEDLTLYDVGRRLGRFLLHEANRCGEVKNGEIYLSLDLTQSQIAARIGTVREVVSRNLMYLKSERLIRLENCRLIISDREKLAEYAKTFPE